MKRFAIRLFSLAAATMIFAASTPALADYGPILELQELANASVAVVRGHVYSVDSGWGDIDSIYTYVRVDVAEVLVGDDVPGRIVVKQLGGVVGEIGQFAGGAPGYAPGEEVVLFLVTRPRDSSVYTAGFWQGKWTVDRSTGAELAKRNAGHDSRGAEVRAESVSLDRLREIAGADSGPRARAPRAVNWNPTEAPSAVNTVLAPTAQKFSLLGFSWHEVFAGTPIPMNFHRTKQPGVGIGRRQVVRTVKNWNAVKRTATALKRGKRKGGAAPGSNLRSGDVSILVQNLDPNGEVSDSDGTLAVGGAWFFNSISVRGLNKGVSGYVLMNDSQQAMLGNKKCYENILKHEGGHAVGQGHSNRSGNLMFPSINFATCTGGIIDLGKDDQRGHRKMYHRKFVARQGQ